EGGQGPARRLARFDPHRGAEDVRARPEPQDGQGQRHRDPCGGPEGRGPRDRVAVYSERSTRAGSTARARRAGTYAATSAVAASAAVVAANVGAWNGTVPISTLESALAAAAPTAPPSTSPIDVS